MALEKIVNIDCEFLVANNIMDHSLLLGIHDGRGTTHQGVAQAKMTDLKRKLIQNDRADRKGELLSVFQQTGAGMRAFGLNGNTVMPRQEIYLFGIIDILQVGQFNRAQRVLTSIIFRLDTIILS